jgi:uncharacterized protein YcbX
VEPTVAQLRIHPIKSLPGVPVSQAIVLASGALAHDREFALFDNSGKVFNGKRDARIHLVRTEYDLSDFTVTVSASDLSATTFHLLDDRTRLEEWFSDFFGLALSLRRDTAVGFPDDLESPGPTVVSEATLAEVSSWFPTVGVGQMCRRFRANVEIGGVQPFWEDQLFGNAGEPVPFALGPLEVFGINPCQRCAVPTRDPDTGEALPRFQRTFSERREASLSPSVVRARFDHFYRLSVNTRIAAAEAGKRLQVGDAVTCAATSSHP